MSFYLPKQKATLSHEAKIAPAAVFTSEGQAAVRASGNTAAGVLPSTGTSSDIFAGFVTAGTSAAPFREQYASKVEKFVVPTSGSVTLARTPVSGQLFAYNDTDGAAISAPTVAGDVVSGLPAGDEVTITYRFALTDLESTTLFGNVVPGGYIGAQIGQIGLVTKGIVYTSNFDNSVNWAAATAIKLAANGQLTDQSGTGVTIPAFVVELPSSDIAYLGIEFDIQ